MALFQRIKTPFATKRPEREMPVPTGPGSAGGVLRQQREAVGLELRDAAQALRIKPAYLSALEEGRPDRLPGPAYAIGFARAYSDYLGLDSEEVLRRFRSEAGGLAARPDLSFPMPLGERSVPGGASLLVGLILAICGYGTWYYLSTGEHSRPERVTEVPAALLAPKPGRAPAAPTAAPTAAAAPAASVSGPTGNPPPPPVPTSERPPTPVSAAASAGPPPAIAATPAIPAIAAASASVAGSVSARPVWVPQSAAVPARPAASGGVGSGPALASATEPAHTYGGVDGAARIVLRATADSWIQVRDPAARAVLFTGLLKAGESYRVPDRPGLSVRTGNAGGLEVTVDGKPAPPLGPVGAVRNTVLDPQSLTAGNTPRN
jgi:cytoskeletal protein RodZ